MYHAEERPPSEFIADRGHLFEVHVVDEEHTEGDQRQDVDGGWETLDRAGSGVAVSVGAEHRDLPLGQPRHGGHMEARAGVRRVPRTQLLSPLPGAGPHEHEVTGVHDDPLRVGHRLQLFRFDSRARLEPVDAAEARYVEHDPTPHDAG